MTNKQCTLAWLAIFLALGVVWYGLLRAAITLILKHLGASTKMGTNYYWYPPTAAPCPHCGRADESERIHIGKSSFGWCFGLHVTDEIPSLCVWVERWEIPGSVIKDEYERIISVSEMESIIKERGREPWDTARREKLWNNGYSRYRSYEDFMRLNHAVEGPEGLLRHLPDGYHCIGHGPGTWDLCRGEFS